MKETMIDWVKTQELPKIIENFLLRKLEESPTVSEWDELIHRIIGAISNLRADEYFNENWHPVSCECNECIGELARVYQEDELLAGLERKDKKRYVSKYKSSRRSQ